MMDWEEDLNGINVMQVQLTDLEDAVHLPPPLNIRDGLVGNHIWRSPEAHARGPVNKPSDMFSFGVVVSCVVRYVALHFEVATDYFDPVHLRGAQEPSL